MAGNAHNFFYLEGCWRKSCSPPSLGSLRNETPARSPGSQLLWCRTNIPFKVTAPCGSGRGASATVSAAARSLAGHHPHCRQLRVRHAARPLARCDSMPCCQRIMYPALRGNRDRANAYYYCTSVAAFASRSLLSARSQTLIRRKF